MLHIIITSLYDGRSPAKGWLTGWLVMNLFLQLIQLPFRVVLQRRLVLISQANIEDIPEKLTSLVTSVWWRLVKFAGYMVYGSFAIGVVLSWWFSVSGWGRGDCVNTHGWRECVYLWVVGFRRHCIDCNGWLPRPNAIIGH